MTPKEKLLEILPKFRLMDDTFMACVFEDISCTQYLLDILLAPKKVLVNAPVAAAGKNNKTQGIR